MEPMTRRSWPRGSAKGRRKMQRYSTVGMGMDFTPQCVRSGANWRNGRARFPFRRSFRVPNRTWIGNRACQDCPNLSTYGHGFNHAGRETTHVPRRMDLLWNHRAVDDDLECTTAQ